jgi:hypothetical protein
MHLAVALGCVVLSACGRPERTPGADTSSRARPSRPAVARPRPAGSAWVAGAGPALFVRLNEGSDSAEIVIPVLADGTVEDSGLATAGRLGRPRLDLFSRAGTSGSGAVRDLLGAVEGECTEWPLASVVPTSGIASGRWTVGLVAGHAAAVALDSIEGLPPGDSARLAADLAGAASALPDDTIAEFRGLPFRVRAAYRFRAAPGMIAVVAEITRTVAQEAYPREERILMIAERPDQPSAAPLVTRYAERASDLEDQVASADVLAVLLLGPDRMPSIIVSREAGEAAWYALLTRDATAGWRLRWSSAATGC